MKDKSWLTALMCFGMFMIMGAPLMGYYPLMILSGLFFIVLSFILMRRTDKRNRS